MNKRPTPETRKAELASLDGTGCVTRMEIIWETMERLERERDEAREQLAYVQAAFDRCKQVGAKTSQLWRNDYEDMAPTIARLQEWHALTDAGLRLRCGEMTAQEIRTVRAVLNAVLTK